MRTKGVRVQLQNTYSVDVVDGWSLVKEGGDVSVDLGAADAGRFFQAPLIGLNCDSSIPDGPLVLVPDNLDRSLLAAL